MADFRFPSGWVFSGYPFFELMMNDSYLVTLISGNYGANPMIYESSDDLYVCRLGRLLALDVDKFVDVGPDCTTISETSMKVLVMAKNDVYRNVINISSASHAPLTLSGLINEGVLSGYITYASLSDNNYFTSLPTLIGNNRKSVSYPRVYRNEADVSPFGPFSKSDTGIPQTETDNAQITVLEAV